MVDFSEREDVKRWLDAIEPETRRREAAVVIAARAALRATPSLMSAIPRPQSERNTVLSAIVLSLFRTIHLSWVVGAYPYDGSDFPVLYAITAADSAYAAVADSRQAMALYVARFAASAAHHASYVARDAAHAIQISVIALDPAYAAAAAGVSPSASAIAVAPDAAWIDGGRSAVNLAMAPLWLNGAPSWATDAWRDLKSAMLASHPDWRVWTDWYEARLSGAPADEALEVARALIDDQIWQQGPRAVNTEIARLIAEHEALKPRPAAFRFPVVDGKIDAAQLDARPLDEETARDFWDEAKRKALDLEAQFSRAQFDGNVRAHVEQLLRRLGASYAEARPGQLISLLRSLESDVRAYDCEEGRKELSAAHLSQILDVTASVRDLCSNFPILREIEFEAVSLNLPPARLAEIRGHIDSVVEIVNHSDGVTDNGREAIGASAENIAHQRVPADEAKQSAYFLVDFAEFTRSGLRYLRGVGGKIGGELGGFGADNWKAFRRGAPRGVERGAAQLGRAVIVGGVGALMHALGNDFAAIAGMVAFYDPLNAVLQHMVHKAAEPPTPDPAPPDEPLVPSQPEAPKARRSRAPRKGATRKSRKA